MKDRIKSMMPFGIILLILSFICYNFLGWKELEPSGNLRAFSGL
jgi:hypothetical protein